ncbi:MAG: EI24 domain-containing protein [Rhodospirillales bacterium]
MFDAIGKALRQLDDPAIQRTLLLSVAIALGCFVALWLVIGFLLSETAIFSIGWLETIVDVLGGLATALFTWLLFPAVVSGLVGVFLDGVARAVEARHYPELGPARGQNVGEAIVSGLKFIGVLVVLNIFMLLFLIVPPVFPFVFYAVNGYLLGREYFELVALRRIGAADARTLRKQRQGALFAAGIAIALLLTVPVVNLLAPIVATATMVHLFQSWRPTAGDGGPLKTV